MEAVSAPEFQVSRGPQEPGVDLTIFVPCYNEEKLIERTLDTIRTASAPFSFRYEVLIYNDGSSDRTASVVADYIRRNGLEGNFELVTSEKNKGIGVNYFLAAERGRGDYFVVFFGDNSEPVESMNLVFNLIGKADVIIPFLDSRIFESRFNTDHRGFFRRFCSINFARLVRIFSGHKIHYFNGFVMHRRKNILKHRVSAYGLGYQAELLTQILNDPSVSFLEVKVACASRESGTPTAFKPKNIVSVAASLGRILWRRITYKQTEPGTAGSESLVKRNSEPV